jgi:hypothetical protein
MNHCDHDTPQVQALAAAIPWHLLVLVQVARLEMAMLA